MKDFFSTFVEFSTLSELDISLENVECREVEGRRYWLVGRDMDATWILVDEWTGEAFMWDGAVMDEDGEPSLWHYVLAELSHHGESLD